MGSLLPILPPELASWTSTHPDSQKIRSTPTSSKLSKAIDSLISQYKQGIIKSAYEDLLKHCAQSQQGHVPFHKRRDKQSSGRNGAFGEGRVESRAVQERGNPQTSETYLEF